jgi:hypothetical protein
MAALFGWPALLERGLDFGTLGRLVTIEHEVGEESPGATAAVGPVARLRIDGARLLALLGAVAGGDSGPWVFLARRVGPITGVAALGPDTLRVDLSVKGP